VVHRRQLQQALPQVLVLDRLARGGAPTVALPPIQPAVGERLLQVLAVRHDTDLGRLDERFQRLDSRRQLHPVVRRTGLETGRLRVQAVALDKERPTAPAGHRVARTIRVDRDVLFAHGGPSLWRARTKRSSTTTAAAWSSACERETWTTSPSSSMARSSAGLAANTGRSPSFTTHTSRQPSGAGHTLANASLAAKRAARPG